MALNWASKDCGARVVSFSSEVNGCEASNVLDPQLSSIWLSEEVAPHWICLSLNGDNRGQKATIRAIGWHCWHPYSTNPKNVSDQLLRNDLLSFVPFFAYFVYVYDLRFISS